jgi:glycine oxidase
LSGDCSAISSNHKTYHKGNEEVSLSRDYDAIIVGAGVIGLSTALSLRKNGLSRILVLDKGSPAREASWAGGGILSPIHPHKYPQALADLCQLSLKLYPAFIDELEASCGFSVEYRSTGLIRLARKPGELADIIKFHKAQGNEFQELDNDQAKALEPALAGHFPHALHESQIHQVRNPRLLKALLATCAQQNVTVLGNEPVERLIVEGSRILGVETSQHRYRGVETILSAGAWSGRLLERSLNRKLVVVPVHGEMVRLETRPSLIKAILINDGAYLIPRADGQVIIGSSLYDCGFDKTVFPQSVQALLAAAIDMVPALAKSEWKQAWAGLRPGSPDRLPYIGRPKDTLGLIVATGHYRNGLLLAPATANLVTSLLLGKSPKLDIDPYAVDRTVPEFKL